MRENVINWNEVAETVEADGVRRRRLERPGMSAVQIHVPQGVKGVKHSHPHDQLVQVISGSGSLTTEDGRVGFSAGSIFVLPKDTWHIADFESDTVLLETNFIR